jgi:hypothetical protein
MKAAVQVSPQLAHALASPIHRRFASQQRWHPRTPLHLGVEFLQQRLDVSPVGRLNRAFERLHVLLRHRLLPQPGGFEGFVFAHVSLTAQNLPSSEREDRCPLCIGVDLHMPRLALSPLHADHGRAIAHVDDFFHLVVDSVEDLPDLSGPYAYSFVAVERSLKGNSDGFLISASSSKRSTSTRGGSSLSAAQIRRTTSTFSWDIARSVSRAGCYANGSGTTRAR